MSDVIVVSLENVIEAASAGSTGNARKANIPIATVNATATAILKCLRKETEV